MDLQFYGANCLVLSSRNGRVVIDDNLSALGAKSVTKPGDIVLFTSKTTFVAPKVETKLQITHGGEYEVSDISIIGVPARSHMDEEDKQTATMYKLFTKDVSVLVTGHIYPELNDDQLETIGMIDVLCVPVGGNGYTLDPVGAMKIIKKIEPKILVLTHYDDSALTYEVPQQTLEQALSSLSMEPKETISKLKLKDLPEELQVVVLEKS